MSTIDSTTIINITANSTSGGQGVDFSGFSGASALLINDLAGVPIQYAVDGVTWNTLAAGSTATISVAVPNMLRFRKTVEDNFPVPLSVDFDLLDKSLSPEQVAAVNVLGQFTITPQMYKANAGMTNGTEDDADALLACVALTQVDGATRIKIDLGSMPYRCSKPICTLAKKPFEMAGNGAWLIYDAAATGDFMSFSNCWYGADTTLLSNGATNPSSSNSAAVTWPGQSSKRAGVSLKGFTVVGDRRSTQTQNGIIFYDRNDYATVEDVEVHFIKGIGICLSGIPSVAGTNKATVMRESYIRRVQARWCGDLITGRPAMMLNCNSQTSVSADDGVNYMKLIDVKVIFPNGVGFQNNCHNQNTNQASNNQIQIQIDAPQGNTGASNTSGFSSITSGVLTISAGGTITGTFSVGQFITNASVPLGTYIISLGTSTGGVGTLNLANRTEDISALTVSSGTLGTLRTNVPCMQHGGGHNGGVYDITINASNLVGNGVVGIEFNQNVLNGSTAKPALGVWDLSIGSIDVGLELITLSSAAVRWKMRNATTSVRVGNITKQVTIDLLVDDPAVNFTVTGAVTNITVTPGMQAVIYGAALPSSAKYPNAFMVLNNGGTITRSVSIAGAWVAA
jgi:hypothetical protein